MKPKFKIGDVVMVPVSESYREKTGFDVQLAQAIIEDVLMRNDVNCYWVKYGPYFQNTYQDRVKEFSESDISSL